MEAPSNTATSTSNEKVTLAVAFSFIVRVLHNGNPCHEQAGRCSLHNTRMVYIDSHRLERHLVG